MKIKVLILGAGAIGSYLGGSLALNGHQVVFLEREKDIVPLKKQGILMDIGGKSIQTTSADFIGSPDQIPDHKFDLVIFAVKAYHLDQILSNLIPIRDQLPPLLCMLNGVDSEIKIREALGSDQVIPGTITTAVDCPAKGNIIVRKMRGMGISGDLDLAQSMVPIFNQAGIHSIYYPDHAAMKWSKLVTNLLGNATSAILNLPTSSIYSNRSLYHVEVEQVREALRVMNLMGIKVVNLPGVPVKILISAIKYLPIQLSHPLLSRLIGGGRGSKMPSFHIDLYSGKGKSEVDQLNGAVVRAGIKYHLPTPVNSFLTSTLKSLINEEIGLDTYSGNIDVFLRDLKIQREF